MAENQTSEPTPLNRDSVADHFDISATEDLQSTKRQRLNSVSSSDNDNAPTAWYENVQIVDVRSPARGRKVPVKRDNDPVYTLSPNPSETVCASFRQNSCGPGLCSTRDSQCMTMALSAIMVSTTLPANTWSTRDMDAILRYGAKSHSKLMKPDWKSIDARVSLNMPVPGSTDDWSNDRPFGAKQIITVYKSDQYGGPVHSRASSQMDQKDTAMKNELDRLMNGNTSGVLIRIAGSTGALMKDNEGTLRYFDSHASNKIGRLNSKGTPVLLTFDTARDFVRYVRRRTSDLQSRYEMIGIKAEVLKMVAVCRPIIRRSS